MKNSNRFGVRIKPNDEKVLQELAYKLERNLSDTIRFAIRFTAREYGLTPDKPLTSKVKKQDKTNLKV